MTSVHSLSTDTVAYAVLPSKHRNSQTGEKIGGQGHTGDSGPLFPSDHPPEFNLAGWSGALLSEV